MFKRFNRWYDSLPEPRRFLFFLTALMGWVPLMYTSGLPLYAGAVWMVGTVSLAISRI